MKDRIAVITGGTSGIGEDIARRFAEKGARVIIVGRRPEQGLEIESGIRESGGDAVFFRADVSVTAECKALFEMIIKDYGKVDILVNSAGITIDMPLVEMTDEAWDEVIRINLRSYFLCCREAARMMIPNGYGRIVNISSRGWLGGTAQSNYAASKGGIVSLTRALALEFARKGITVNCVAPGMIDTPLFRKSNPEDVAFRIERQPMGRIGKSKDITNAVMYFAAEENDFVTGQVLYVCGGMSVLASMSS